MRASLLTGHLVMLTLAIHPSPALANLGMASHAYFPTEVEKSRLNAMTQITYRSEHGLHDGPAEPSPAMHHESM